MQFEETMPLIVLEGIAIVRDTHIETIEVVVEGDVVHNLKVGDVLSPDSLARVHQAVHTNAMQMQAVMKNVAIARSLPLFFHPEDATEEQQDQEAEWVSF